MTNKAENEVLQEQVEVSKSVQKLNRKSLDIEVLRNLSLVEIDREALKELETLEGPSDKKEAARKEIQERLTKEENNIIKATLVRLNHLDILTVQGYVADAVLRGNEAQFDTNVRLFLAVRAENCATVFYGMRKQENHAEKYFSDLEDVTVLDQRTLEEIKRLYQENFQLTDEQRKN